MKCKDCPARGYTRKNGKDILLCCCSCHETTETEPEAECKYGIEDYERYWKSLSNKKKGEKENDD